MSEGEGDTGRGTDHPGGHCSRLDLDSAETPGLGEHIW